jgi:hypothetical protein
MIGTLLCGICFMALPAAADVGTAQHPHFPKPPLLAPNVAFWKQVYTEHGVGDFVLHDRDNLGVIYEVIRVPENGNQIRAAVLAKPEIERARSQYRDLLLRLAGGAAPEDLGAEGRRVAAMWGCPCSPEALRRAADNIRAQQGLREKVDEGLHRAQTLLPRIVTILRKHDVPVELAALPLVESTFDPKAYSKAGASGLWQFIRSTGRQYSLVTRKRDDRRDPVRATEAAAKLLRNNYEALGSWPLAIVAYNHGHAGIRTASAVVGSTAIEDIIARYDGPRFGFASKNFYAEFLAALELLHPYLAGHGKPLVAKKRQHGTQTASLREQRPPVTTSVPEKAAPAPSVESERKPEPAAVLTNPTPFDRSLILDEMEGVDLSIDLSSVTWLLEQPTARGDGVVGADVPPLPAAEEATAPSSSEAEEPPKEEQLDGLPEPVSSPPVSF